MKTRIKYIKKNTTGYYAVQIKGWIFWKTIYINDTFANVEKFIDTLGQIDEFNNKTKSLDKIVYEGWAVRNVYANTGPSFSVSFFNSPIHKRESDDKTKMIWVTGISGTNTVPLLEIHAKTLFGKECLDPIKLRITIEQL